MCHAPIATTRRSDAATNVTSSATFLVSTEVGTKEAAMAANRVEAQPELTRQAHPRGGFGLRRVLNSGG